jgi:hypothetical protein
MKNTSLSDKLRQLLEEVVRSRRPDMLHLVQGTRLQDLPFQQRLELRHELQQEFSSTGLREDSEPNSRGLDLEELIAILGPQRGE